MNSTAGGDRSPKSEETVETTFDSAGAESASFAPRAMYFYYLNNFKLKDGDPEHVHADVQAFLVPIHGNVSNAIEEMVKRVQDEAVMPIGFSFRHVVWVYRSIVVIVADDPEYTLSKGGINLGESGNGDHTFDNKRNITPSENVTGLMFTNHVNKKGGGPWTPRDPDDYPIIFAFGRRSEPASLFRRRSDEDSATNLGPPH